MVLSSTEYLIAVLVAFHLNHSYTILTLSSGSALGAAFDGVPFFCPLSPYCPGLLHLSMRMCLALPKIVPMPFLSFLLGMLWGCRGQNHPRLYIKATWTFIVCPRQLLSSARALGPNVKWARVTNSIAPQLDLNLNLKNACN